MEEQIAEAISFSISDQETHLRLDKLLAERFTQSRHYFQHLIEKKFVTVNSKVVKKRERLREGDCVEIQFVLTPEIDLRPEAIPLDILYEDEHLLAIDKPAGMVVHPAPGHWSGTFVNALLHHCQSLQGDKTLRPGIVHRLDKDTTGLLLAAKTEQAHRNLVQLFASRKIEKNYLAICVGHPGRGQIEAPIGRHAKLRKQMAISPTGRPARSMYETIAYNSQLSAVRIVLITGRTHQARVHMSYAGFPILGDATYGRLTLNAKMQIHRQLLHAQTLCFPHPITHRPLTLNAPIPLDIEKMLDLMRRE